MSAATQGGRLGSLLTRHPSHSGGPTSNFSNIRSLNPVSRRPHPRSKRQAGVVRESPSAAPSNYQPKHRIGISSFELCRSQSGMLRSARGRQPRISVRIWRPHAFSLDQLCLVSPPCRQTAFFRRTETRSRWKSVWFWRSPSCGGAEAKHRSAR